MSTLTSRDSRASPPAPAAGAAAGASAVRGDAEVLGMDALGADPSSRSAALTCSIMSPGPQTKYSRTALGIEERARELADALRIQASVVELPLPGARGS